MEKPLGVAAGVSPAVEAGHPAGILPGDVGLKYFPGDKMPPSTQARPYHYNIRDFLDMAGFSIRFLGKFIDFETICLNPRWRNGRRLACRYGEV